MRLLYLGSDKTSRNVTKVEDFLGWPRQKDFQALDERWRRFESGSMRIMYAKGALLIDL